MVFLITLLIVCVLLLLGFACSSRKNKAKVIGFFVEDADTPPSRPYFSFRKNESGNSGKKQPPEKTQRPPARTSKRNSNQSHTEMAILQLKIDERRRVVDSNGHSTLYDEYFELVFETRKGETLNLVASRAAFKEIPFNQEGALTYKKDVLVKFKYAGGLISDEYSPLQNRV